jgi:hypothetical protein
VTEILASHLVLFSAMKTVVAAVVLDYWIIRHLEHTFSDPTRQLVSVSQMQMNQ